MNNEAISLGSLGLSSKILKATKDQGYTHATPIQQKLIPLILSGSDVLAGAKTGTGKTAAFMLPIISKLSLLHNQSHFPKVIIIAPTKELARQIFKNTQTYTQHTNIKTTLLYGGTNLQTQAKSLKSGTDIVISTPGRLLEHINQGNVNLNDISHIVLDEADTILDMGFIHEVSQILSHLPSKCQSILISATLTPRLKQLANDMLNKPKLIEIDSIGIISNNIKQFVYPVIAEQKDELLAYLIGSNNYKSTLVFVRKKELCDTIAQELNNRGLKSLAIHGGKTSGARAKALEKFTNNTIQVLVATDIAARGLDIPHIDAVINYDIPHVQSDYIHRIGRTGRSGKDGIAISLISPEQNIALQDLERLLKKQISRVHLNDYAPKRDKAKKTKITPIAHKTGQTKGAFGNRKNRQPKNKKRKTTKRDAWKKR